MTFYLGTIAFSIAGHFLFFLKVMEDIKNTGYKFKRKQNIFNSCVKYFPLLCVPVFNLSLTVIFIVSADRFSKDFINTSIANGILVRKDDSKVIEEVELDNNLVEDAKVVVYKVEDKEKKELTIEEKLEFLQEEYKRLTGEEMLDNVKGKQRGIGKRRL